MQKIDGITEKQAEQLYNLNIDGWISSCTRNSLLWGECNGNSKHEHYFNYFGTPSTYKVIIVNYDTGKVKATNVINRTDFNSNIIIDYETMNVKNDITNNNEILSILIPISITLLVTIAVEMIILVCFRIINKKNLKIVLLTNIISNMLLQILMVMIDKTNGITGMIKLCCFIILEIIILIIETLIYLQKMETDKRNRIIPYAIIANMLSFSCTFIQWYIFYY